MKKIISVYIWHVSVIVGVMACSVFQAITPEPYITITKNDESMLCAGNSAGVWGGVFEGVANKEMTKADEPWILAEAYAWDEDIGAWQLVAKMNNTNTCGKWESGPCPWPRGHTVFYAWQIDTLKFNETEEVRTKANITGGAAGGILFSPPLSKEFPPCTN